MTSRYCRIAAVACLLIAVMTASTVLVAFFDPPPWNRAERLLAAFGWFYVGYIHWRLAKEVRA